MTFLLDVNVVIALIDPAHVAHDDAHRWFVAREKGFATCPITENGVIRIIGHPRYPNSPGTAAVANIVAQFKQLADHEFWPDDLSLTGSAEVDAAKILTSDQVTDTYLLALAKTHGGQLATFDRKLSTAAVRRGADALHLIATGLL